MKVVKALLIIIAVMAVIAGLFWQFFLKEQMAFADVATAYGAKQVCSCLHVAERDLESCEGDFTEDVSAVTFTALENGARASVLGGLVSAEAQLEPGLGCSLMP